MAIGNDVIKQILDAAAVRAVAFFTSNFQALKYTLEIEKNQGNIPFGYGFNALDAVPGDNPVLGSYCLTLNLELVLLATIVKKGGEDEIKAAINTLHAWIDRAAKDFRASKLGLPNVVLRITDHTIGAPQYMEDSTKAVIKTIFPVVFRQSLAS